tara:strand:+ start:4411 stop:4740 length:330 start_codon:yes stop_codon:yes gene_type:complete
MTIPTPVWLKKQNLTTDLYDIMSPRMDYETKHGHDGLLRAVAKEVIQAGYRKTITTASKGVVRPKLNAELYALIKPRVSVWVQTNHDDKLRTVLDTVIFVGYRMTKESK